MAVDEVRFLMAEKGVTDAALEAEGWGPVEDLSADDLVDVTLWLSERPDMAHAAKKDRSPVQQKMVEEVHAAALVASDAQADPVAKRGLLYEKKVGRYTVVVDRMQVAEQEGKVMLVCSALVGNAVFRSERQVVDDNPRAVEGKTKQAAFRMIESLRAT